MSCPYGRRNCGQVDEDTDLYGTADGWLHRHDHRRCYRNRLGLWQHPGDLADEWHREPMLYDVARQPLQRRWPEPWRVVATSLLLVMTSWRQAERAAEQLHRLVDQPADLTLADVLAPTLAPLGLAERRQEYLSALAEAWPVSRETPAADEVAAIKGCGPYVVDAYRIFVLRDPPPPVEVADPVLRLHLEMSSVYRAI